MNTSDQRNAGKLSKWLVALLQSQAKKKKTIWSSIEWLVEGLTRYLEGRKNEYILHLLTFYSLKNQRN